MRDVGVQFHSTQWVGWVPQDGACGGDHNAQWSNFVVQNLRVSGTVVQGGQPQRCSGEALNGTTTFLQ